MKELDIDPSLARASLRKQIGGSYDIFFLETRLIWATFDKSIKQGGEESPSFSQYDDEECHQTTTAKVEGREDSGKNEDG